MLDKKKKETERGRSKRITDKFGWTKDDITRMRKDRKKDK